MTGGPTEDRSARWERRLAVPVLVAALASVPAVFLTLAGGTLAMFGEVLHWVSGAVLVAESVVLLALSSDRLGWLRRNRGLVGFTLVVVPVTVLALGPLQVLRLLYTVGTLRLVRARRIVRATMVLHRRFGPEGPWASSFALGAGTLAAVFVAITLVDPSSRSRLLLEQWLGWTGNGRTVAVCVAGAVVFGATWVALRNRGPASPADDAD
ncbi:hypothetical protein O7608_22305 [Solwaraspora sp. WMMA2056]|uniref:hypothetical protein n=1 Tax=Solwaraspora sp. WMMA2056 TaxID=3015161 RepID=UPI00259B47C0|nr:hypothetical protein [Solwaraspora sp. WMMA2056]WJK39188.1 hypothetical protein O7608_22305 [Solwaraspora sp. WMMA2056]